MNGRERFSLQDVQVKLRAKLLFAWLCGVSEVSRYRVPQHFGQAAHRTQVWTSVPVGAIFNYDQQRFKKGGRTDTSLSARCGRSVLRHETRKHELVMHQTGRLCHGR